MIFTHPRCLQCFPTQENLTTKTLNPKVLSFVFLGFSLEALLKKWRMKPFIVFNKCQIRPPKKAIRPPNSCLHTVRTQPYPQIRPPKTAIRPPKKAKPKAAELTQNRPLRTAIRPPFFYSFRTSISSQFHQSRNMKDQHWIYLFIKGNLVLPPSQIVWRFGHFTHIKKHN